MKRICAYMMAALLALSSVFCPAIPVLAEGEEIIDASGYGTMVEDVLMDRFHGMEPSQQESVFLSAYESFGNELIETLSNQELSDLTEQAMTEIQEVCRGTSVNYVNVAPLSYTTKSIPEVATYGIKRMAMSIAENAKSDDEANDSGLHLDKKVVYDSATENYMVQLEAYTTGTVTTTTEYIPADIILVLDFSGSMKSNQISGQKRIDALESAVDQFINEVKSQANEYGVNHRMALITFGAKNRFSYYYNDDGWEYDRTGTDYYNNSGLYVGSNCVLYPNVTNNNCKNALTSNYDTISTALQTAYNEFYANNSSSAATFPSLGLNLANRIFGQTYDKSDGRNRVVVLFSDGGPGNNSRWFDVNEALAAIGESNSIKDNYNATVYSVGIFTGADATTKGTDPGGEFEPSTDYLWSNQTNIQYKYHQNGVDGNYYTHNQAYHDFVLKYDGVWDAAHAATYTAYCNWLLQKISSNNGSVKKPSYYLTPTESSGLTGVFKDIANTVSAPSISLETETVIRDYMSSYFKLPAGTDASKVVIKTAEYSAEGTFGEELDQKCGATAKIEADGSVSVTGFNFNHYFCTPTEKNTGDKSYGRKLIIRFPIEPVAGFLGGNNVPTNDPTKSGVYTSGTETTPIATFPAPSANVPLVLPDFAVTDKTVYYGTQVTPDELYTPFTPANDVADDFVKITYVKPAQTDISDEACTENLNYTLQIVAKSSAVDSSVGTKQPTTVTNAAKQQRTKQANVHVLVPEKTFEDSSIYLGQTADYTNNGADTAHTWIDQSGHTTYPAVTGTAPEVVFTYNPAEGAFEKDTPVNVTAKIGGEEATDAVSFKWTDCTANHGSLPKIASPHLGSVDTPEFYVHILNNSLTITKTGLNQFVYTDGSDQESAIFTVKEEGGKGRTWTVAINGNDSVTLDGLYVGVKYIVQELNDWTWRYNNNDAHFKLLDEGTNNVFTFENVLREDKAWLNGDNYENNVFGNGAVSPTESIPPAGN